MIQYTYQLYYIMNICVCQGVRKKYFVGKSFEKYLLELKRLSIFAGHFVESGNV